MAEDTNGGASTCPGRVRSEVGDPAMGDPKRILSALGDEKANQILQATTRPKTVAELTDELGLSSSTAYRKIAELEELELLVPTNPDTELTVPTRYQRSVQDICVCTRRMIRFDYDDGSE